MSQGPDLLLGTWFSVGVRCSALLVDTQADHMSLHGHKPLTTAMDLDWSWPWGCPQKERWEPVMSVFLFLFLLLASQHSFQDLSSSTKDRIHALSSESAES